MSRHGLLRSSAANSGSAPASLTKPKKRRCGEVMGGATAECTAVVCCCPFAAMDVLALALYEAPKGMCRRAIEKRRRKMKVKRMLKQQAAEEPGRREEVEETVVGNAPPPAAEEVAAAMDMEMYDKFYGTGFWRSSSQRSTSPSV